MTRVLILVALAILGANALTPKDPPYGQLSVKGTKLVGKDGNPVQLIGMSLFWSQWMGQFFNRDTVNALACQWGSNVVRAAMGVSEGGTGYLHDKSELTKVRTVVEAAIERGIYVIIDWHDHNAHQHKADAIAFFQQMATDYGKYPHVLYETFNEPLQISWQNDLKPYHTDVVNAIRKIDAKNVALLGTPAWSGESGITDASNSPLTGLTNVMYVQHFYSGSHRDSARSAYSNAAAKIPVFISEYGISNADGGSDGQIFPDETNKWFQLLDVNKASYLAWSIADKNEASSALKPGTSPSQVGNDAQLSASGTFLKKMILGKKLFTCSGALPPASPSPPSPPSAPSPPSPPSPPSSGGGSGSASVSVKSAQSWNGGGVANVVVTNNGDKPICGFTLELTSGSIRAGEFWSLVSSDRKIFTNQYPINLSKGQSWPTGADTAGGTYDGAQPTFKVASTKAC